MADQNNNGGDTSPISNNSRVLIVGLAFIGLVAPVLIILFAPYRPEWPTINAVLLGVGVAAIVYHFLGGKIDATFKTPVVSIAGAGALLVCVAWIGHEWLDSAATQRQVTEAAIKNAVKAQTDRVGVLEPQNKALTKRLTELQKDFDQNTAPATVDSIVARVRETLPGSDLSKAIIKVQREHLGPWAERMGAQPVLISFAGIGSIRTREADGKTHAFTACPGLGFNGNTVVFTLDEQEGASGDSVEAVYAGPMPTNYCTGADSNRVQLSCESAKIFLPSLVADCSATGDVMWKDPSMQKRYAASSELRNPDIQ